MHPDPLSAWLDTATAPQRFFIRSDDGGWGDDALMALLDLTARAGVPVDVAMIPEATTPALAAALTRRQAAAPALLGLHQHGRAHVNHQPEGRRGEFGDARSLEALRTDLHAGRHRLQALLGAERVPGLGSEPGLGLDPIFTPPWNRCSPALPALLAEGGWRALSREHRATPQQWLAELPVHVDCSRVVREARAAGQAISAAIAAAMAAAVSSAVSSAVSAAVTSAASVTSAAGQARALASAGDTPPAETPPPIGLMLHHAAMDDAERQALEPLLAAWSRHPRARWCRMSALLPAATDERQPAQEAACTTA